MTPSPVATVDGVLRCARYSFGPNRLHYCGPDANHELLAYLREGFHDPGLTALLSAFQTLAPYLRHIAEQNKIRDPFDDRVVEAYWIGNDLLETIPRQALWRHLIDDHGMKRRLGIREFSRIEEKIARGAVPTHVFHVLNIWKRTGHLDRAHTLESMDACRVSWGVIRTIDGPRITIETKPLITARDQLSLGEPIMKTITRRLEADSFSDDITVGDTISVHWDTPCEIIEPRHVVALEKYTLQSIALANT